MPAEIYEVVALAARFWFLFLMALIVWRSYRWYARERKQRKKRLRLLPDAGYIGELVVVSGAGSLRDGDVLSVPFEGTLGSLRSNDLCVPANGVEKKHLWFSYDEKKGIVLTPVKGSGFAVDGIESTDVPSGLCMVHGSRLYVGECQLRLRMFAGYDVGLDLMGGGYALRREMDADGEDTADSARMVAPVQDATPQQMQMWQQYQQYLQYQQAQQQQYMQQMAWQQWMAQQWAQQQAAQNAAQSAAQGSSVAAFQRPAQPVSQPAQEEIVRPSGDSNPYARPSRQISFEVDQPFYPPEMEAEDEDAWPLLQWPEEMQDAELFDEYGEDEDRTDASMPPKSAYVGRDEAARAKERFWDKYLGGGV